jgi:hypothetical protein
MPFDDTLSNSVSTTTPDQTAPVTGTPSGDSSAMAPQFQASQSTQSVSPSGVQSQTPNPSQATSQQIVSNVQPARDPNADHPSVKHASIVRSVAETLAGGPHYRTETDVNTGEIKRVPVPLSGREIAMAIAMEAISGSFAGLAGGRGKGAGAAGVAGMQAGGKLVQQRRDQENQDTQLAEQNMARHYQVAEANMRMLSLAQTMGRMDQEQHENMVKMSADQLKYLKDTTPELIANERVSEAEAKDLNKYPLNEYTRIPDGVTPRLDVNGNSVFIDAAGKPVPEGTPGSHPAMDNTYSVVHKNAKIGLVNDGAPAEFIKQAVDWGLLDKSWTKAAPGSEMSAPLAATISRKVDSLNAAQSDLTRYYAALNDNASKGHAKPSELGTPKYQPADLRTEIGKDPSLATALDKFQGIFNQTGSREAAIGELAKKDPRAAGKVARLYGGRDALHEFDMQQKLKDLQLVNNAELDKERALIPIKAAAAGAEARAREQASQPDNLSENEIVNGMLDGSLDITKTASIRNNQRERYIALAKQKDPSFNMSTYSLRLKMNESYTSGKQGDQIQSFNTFMQHAADASDVTSEYRQGRSPLLNKSLNWIRKNATGDPGYAKFVAAMEPVRKEFATFLEGGHALTESDKEAAQTILSDESSPAQIQAALKQMAHTGSIRLGSLDDRYRATFGHSYQGLLYPDTIVAAQKLGLGDFAARYSSGRQGSPASVSNVQSPPASILKEGMNTNFANGQTWTLRNGQPTQVK